MLEMHPNASQIVINIFFKKLSNIRHAHKQDNISMNERPMNRAGSHEPVDTNINREGIILLL